MLFWNLCYRVIFKSIILSRSFRKKETREINKKRNETNKRKKKTKERKKKEEEEKKSDQNSDWILLYKKRIGCTKNKKKLLIFFIQKLWSTIFLYFVLIQYFFSHQNYKSSSFLYLSLPFHFTLLFYHLIRHQYFFF